MKKFICALFLASSLLFNAFGQKNFLTGYILASAKDTIKGFVDYRNWEKNPSIILFKQTISDPAKSYGVNDIVGFEVVGFDIYKKAIVSLDMNPVRLGEVSTYDESLVKKDTVFLRFLAKGGRLKLYEFVDQKYHFFMQNGDGQVEELAYKLTIDEPTGKMSTDNGYMRQIKKALAETSLTLEQSITIDRLKYNSDILTKFFLSLEGIKETNHSVVPGANNKKKNRQFFAGGGLVYQKLGFGPKNTILGSLNFDPTLAYIIAGGIDLFTTRNFRNLVFRGELSLSEFRGDGSGYSETSVPGVKQHNEYTFKQINMAPSISLLYNFFGSRKTKVYAGMSMAYNFSMYPDHTLKTTNGLTGSVSMNDEYPELKKQWVGIYLRAGVITCERFELGLTGQIGGSFISYSGTGETSSPVSLRFSYRVK